MKSAPFGNGWMPGAKPLCIFLTMLAIADAMRLRAVFDLFLANSRNSRSLVAQTAPAADRGVDVLPWVVTSSHTMLDDDRSDPSDTPSRTPGITGQALIQPSSFSITSSINDFLSSSR